MMIDDNGYLGFYTTNSTPQFAERARITSTGNLGIATATPGQKLEVNGGVRLNTVAAKPTCDATARGTFWVTQGITGGGATKDSVEVCAKDAADVYAWRTIY